MNENNACWVALFDKALTSKEVKEIYNEFLEETFALMVKFPKMMGLFFRRMWHLKGLRIWDKPRKRYIEFCEHEIRIWPVE